VIRFITAVVTVETVITVVAVITVIAVATVAVILYAANTMPLNVIVIVILASVTDVACR